MYSKPIQIELIKRPLVSSQQITCPHHSEAEKVVPSIKSALWPNKGPHKKIQSLSFLEPEAKPAPVQSYSFCLRFLQNKRMFSIIIFKRKNKTKVLLFLVTGSEASLPPQSVSSSNTAGHWPRRPSTAQAWRPSPMALASPSRLAPPRPAPRFPARAPCVPAHRPGSSREATAPLQLPPASGARALGGQDHQRVAGAVASRWVLGRWCQRE
jgi:hypothetical protein